MRESLLVSIFCVFIVFASFFLLFLQEGAPLASKIPFKSYLWGGLIFIFLIAGIVSISLMLNRIQNKDQKREKSGLKGSSKAL